MLIHVSIKLELSRLKNKKNATGIITRIANLKSCGQAKN